MMHNSEITPKSYKALTQQLCSEVQDDLANPSI